MEFSKGHYLTSLQLNVCCPQNFNFIYLTDGKHIFVELSSQLYNFLLNLVKIVGETLNPLFRCSGTFLIPIHLISFFSSLLLKKPHDSISLILDWKIFKGKELNYCKKTLSPCFCNTLTSVKIFTW